MTSSNHQEQRVVEARGNTSGHDRRHTSPRPPETPASAARRAALIADWPRPAQVAALMAWDETDDGVDQRIAALIAQGDLLGVGQPGTSGLALATCQFHQGALAPAMKEILSLLRSVGAWDWEIVE